MIQNYTEMKTNTPQKFTRKLTIFVEHGINKQ